MAVSILCISFPFLLHSNIFKEKINTIWILSFTYPFLLAIISLICPAFFTVDLLANSKLNVHMLSIYFQLQSCLFSYILASHLPLICLCPYHVTSSSTSLPSIHTNFTSPSTSCSPLHSNFHLIHFFLPISIIINLLLARLWNYFFALLHHLPVATVHPLFTLLSFMDFMKLYYLF